MASPVDPAWVAALALAAGRGQPIAWLDQPLGGLTQAPLFHPVGRRHARQRAEAGVFVDIEVVIPGKLKEISNFGHDLHLADAVDAKVCFEMFVEAEFVK